MARDYYYYDRARDARGSDLIEWSRPSDDETHRIWMAILAATHGRANTNGKVRAVIRGVRELTGEKLLSVIQ